MARYFAVPRLQRLALVCPLIASGPRALLAKCEIAISLLIPQVFSEVLSFAEDRETSVFFMYDVGYAISRYSASGRSRARQCFCCDASGVW